jgi:hypothetical protein
VLNPYFIEKLVRDRQADLLRAAQARGSVLSGRRAQGQRRSRDTAHCCRKLWRSPVLNAARTRRQAALLSEPTEQAIAGAPTASLKRPAAAADRMLGETPPQQSAVHGAVPDDHGCPAVTKPPSARLQGDCPAISRSAHAHEARDPRSDEAATGTWPGDDQSAEHRLRQTNDRREDADVVGGASGRQRGGSKPNSASSASPVRWSSFARRRIRVTRVAASMVDA